MAWFDSVLTGLLPLLILAAVYGLLLWRRWQGRAPGDRIARHFMEPRVAKEAEVEKTVFARLGGPSLPFSAGVVARSGTGRAADRMIDEHVLRPTLGVRAVSLISAGAILFVIWGTPGALVPSDGPITWGLTALIAYSVVYLFSYELRYDRDRIIAQGWAFNRREHAWRDLVRIRDNGHYLYVLNFEDGSRLEVQKYLAGMPDFLTFAQTRIAENLRGECQNSRKSKPSAADSLQQWTGTSSRKRL